MVSLIDASPHDAGTAYVAVDRHKLDDFKPLHLQDRRLRQDLDADRRTAFPTALTCAPCAKTRRARACCMPAPRSASTFRSTTARTGSRCSSTCRRCRCTTSSIKDDDLVVATHGRAFWILDDLSPLRQMPQRCAPTRTSTCSRRRPRSDSTCRRRWSGALPAGDNPPPGAVVDYYLKSAPAGNEEIVLEILDKDGKPLKRFSNIKPKDGAEQPPEWVDREPAAKVIPAAAGANRFAWDFRREDPVAIPGAFYSDDGPRGPVVNPGHYQVRLTVHGKSQTAPLEIVLDPRLKGQVTDRDLADLDDLVMRAWTDIDALHRAVNQIRDTRSRLQTIQKWSADNAAAKPVLDAAEALIAKMAPIEARLVQVQMAASEDNLRYPNMLNEQYDTFVALMDTDFAPTEPERQVFAYLHGELGAELAKWRAIAEGDLPALNVLLHQQGVPAIGSFRAP